MVCIEAKAILRLTFKNPLQFNKFQIFFKEILWRDLMLNILVMLIFI